MFPPMAKFSYPAHIVYITTDKQAANTYRLGGKTGGTVLGSFSTVLTQECLDSGTENLGSASPRGSENCALLAKESKKPAGEAWNSLA